MKLTMQRIQGGEEEVIIRYHDMSDQIITIAGIVQGTAQKLRADLEGQTLLLLPEEILYLENVDGETYAYLPDKVARITQSLRELALCYGNRG